MNSIPCVLDATPSEKQGGGETFSALLPCSYFFSRAIGKLEGLGSGFKIHSTLEERKLVQSVPMEFSQDHAQILGHASKTGHTSVAGMACRVT